MRRAVAVVLALLGGALAVVTVGAYVFSTFCWEYCEPEDEPTVWDGFKFALPFGDRGDRADDRRRDRSDERARPWLRALAIALGLCVVGRWRSGASWAVRSDAAALVMALRSWSCRGADRLVARRLAARS